MKMNGRKKLAICLLMVILFMGNFLSYKNLFGAYENSLMLSFVAKTDFSDNITFIFGDENGSFSDGNQKVTLSPGVEQQIEVNLSPNATWVNIMFSQDSTSTTTVTMFSISKLWMTNSIPIKIEEENHVLVTEQSDTHFVAASQSVDSPYLRLALNAKETNIFLQESRSGNNEKFFVFIFLADIVVLIGIITVIKSSLIKALLKNKQLVITLSKNDFKTKYSGSVFGVFWAFVQPIITVAIYVFVFQVGFKAAPAGNYPFVLWLVSGIIVWFFFAEGLMTMANSFIEYSYLVKKVVFEISILPVVKIISGLFIHLFFIAIALLLFVLMGYPLSIYLVQIIYYVVCVMSLLLSFSYLVSSITPFFRDFTQIINIFTQIGMWMTPIMWNVDMISLKFQWIFKLNPMYYIVEGYRDAYLGRLWFWEKPLQTLYFWAFVILFFNFGSRIFKRLKPHFSDVL